MNKRELNKLIKKVESCSSITELKYFCNYSKVGLEGYLDSYLTDNEAFDYIKNTCDSMIRLYYCTQEIKNWEAEYFYLNNYSNLENVEVSLSDLKNEVIEELENKLD